MRILINPRTQRTAPACEMACAFVFLFCFGSFVPFFVACPLLIQSLYRNLGVQTCFGREEYGREWEPSPSVCVRSGDCSTLGGPLWDSIRCSVFGLAISLLSGIAFVHLQGLPNYSCSIWNL
jgi:hypothetical protein